MIYDITYKNVEVEAAIDDFLGKPFSLRKRFQLGGIGSKRMIISSVSLSFNHFLNSISDLNYANIELRPKGIIVLINKGLANFAWCVPYQKLSIYNTITFGLYSDGNFIRFSKDTNFSSNKKFINKLLSLRVDYLNDIKLI